MKLCALFVLVLCVHSSFQQLNRKQPDPSALSYAEADFNPLPPVTRPTTTTPAPESTTKKKGFFSGLTGLFKSKDKETTTTEAPTTQKPKISSTTTTTTAKSVPVTPSTPRPVPVTPTTAKSVPVTPSRIDIPNVVVVSTPKVPPRGESPTPPTRPSVQQPTQPSKTTKDDFPPLPGQSTSKPGQPSVPSVWGTPPTTKSPLPNAWGTPPTTNAPPPNVSGPTQKPLATPNAWGTSPSTQKPQSSTPSTKKPAVAQTPVSSGPATDAELLTLSESLFSKDIHNPFKYVTVNYQGKSQYGSTADQASQPLLSIDEKLWSVSTVEKMKAFYNNYEQDTAINEYVSPIERKEEDDFIDAVLATPVMRHAMNFLTQKGVVTADPQTHRELLRTIWFGLYSRGGGKISSSGFEHVFLSEVKNGTVMGLHNWVYLSEAEKSGDLDYKGWSKKIDLGNKGQIAKIRFSLNQLDKPSNSLFIGTSPELELAIYTVCFELRADKDCRLAYGGKDFNIVTHSYKYRGKNMIGSAYPEI